MGGSLWPGNWQDAPYNLVSAVSEALTVLSWHEKLPKDEVPPRHIWWSSKLLDQWFEDVDKKRKDRTSGKKSTYDSADEVPMMGNQLAEQDDHR